VNVREIAHCSDSQPIRRSPPAVFEFPVATAGTKQAIMAETSATEDENHWILASQLGELPAFCSVAGKLIVGEDSSRAQCQIA
jgi:hypothetical protein